MSAATTCRLWTRLPAGLSALDTIWIGYGNTGSALSQPAPAAQYGSQEVYQDDVLRGHDPGVDLTGAITPTITGTAVGSGPNGGPARGFGVTHGVDSGDSVDSNVSTEYNVRSYATWVYVEADGGTNKLLFSKVPSSGHQIRRRTSGEIEVNQQFTSGLGQWRGGSVPLDTWTHVAVTYDGSSVSNDPVIYINASSVSVSEIQTPVGTPSASGDYWDGSVNFASQTMDGLIAERLFRDSIMTSAYISALYSNQNAVGSFWSIGAGQAV